MSTVRELHNMALATMYEAESAQSSNTITDARNLYKKACDFESKAAASIPIDLNNEPTRSILYLSAASLAWKATDFYLAERLIGQGIAGYPSEHTKKDLYKLLDQVKYDLMRLKEGSRREEASVNMRLYGGHIRHGIAPLGTIKKRLEGLSTIFAKTEQRLSNNPYSDGRKLNKDFPPYELSMEWAEAASFGVIIRLADTIEKQIPLPISRPSVQDVIDDVMTNIEMLNSGDLSGLERSINDSSYFTNFLAHAKSIAPDGDKVRSVGISSSKKTLMLHTTKTKINEYILSGKQPPDASPADNKGSIRGYLDIADRKKNMFTLTDLNDKQHVTQVQSGLEGLARAYFGVLVDVDYEIRKKKMVLLNISAPESDE